MVAFIDKVCYEKYNNFIKERMRKEETDHGESVDICRRGRTQNEFTF
jgi:hypothetical protein